MLGCKDFYDLSEPRNVFVGPPGDHALQKKERVSFKYRYKNRYILIKMNNTDQLLIPEGVACQLRLIKM